MFITCSCINKRTGFTTLTLKLLVSVGVHVVIVMRNVHSRTRNMQKKNKRNYVDDNKNKKAIAMFCEEFQKKIQTKMLAKS